MDHADFEELANHLSPHLREDLARKDLGPLSFQEAIPMLESIRKDISELLEMDLNDYPVNSLGTIENYAKRNSALHQTLRQMKEWDPTYDDNASNTRQRIIDTVREARDTIARTARPLLRSDTERLRASKGDLRNAVEAAQEYRKMADEAAEEVREVARQVHEGLELLKSESVQRANSRISTYYHETANQHGKTASWYLGSAAVFATISGVLVWLLFFVNEPKDDNLSSREIITALTGRSLLLILAGVGLTFCLRNYRTNKHLQVVNMTRYNALETASLYVEGVTSDNARDIVVAELVRAVFSQIDTGYMNTDRDQTVLETPGALIGLLNGKGK